MDPEVWGPKLWFVIHTFALNYPDNPTYEDKRVMEEFFNNLKYSIPCNKCRVHYRQRLQRDPIINYLDNRQSLFKYTIDLHNQVNKSLGKKIYSYEEVNNYYLNLYNSGQPDMRYINNQSNYKYIIYILILSLLFYIFYNFYISNNKWGESKN